jgi:hypothetical protein
MMYLVKLGRYSSSTVQILDAPSRPECHKRPEQKLPQLHSLLHIDKKPRYKPHKTWVL